MNGNTTWFDAQMDLVIITFIVYLFEFKYHHMMMMNYNKVRGDKQTLVITK